jgi:hypothetical protein
LQNLNTELKRDLEGRHGELESSPPTHHHSAATTTETPSAALDLVISSVLKGLRLIVNVAFFSMLSHSLGITFTKQ